MLAYRQGDKRAFDELYRRYSPALLRMFRARGISDSHSQDLTQQTFLHLHRARKDFRSGSKLRPWLYTIASNTRRQFFRRGSRKPESPLESAEEPSTQPGQAMNAQHDVRKAIAQLTEDMADVVLLHWFAGLTFPEIAQVLGIGVPTAKGRAHRAYAALRIRMESSNNAKSE